MKIFGRVAYILRPLYKKLDGMLSQCDFEAGPVDGNVWLSRLNIRFVSIASMQRENAVYFVDREATANSICVSVVYKGKHTSPSFIAYIRKQESITTISGPITAICKLYLDFSPLVLRALSSHLELTPGYGVCEGLKLRLMAVESLATPLRQFNCLQCVSELPETIQSVLMNCGISMESLSAIHSGSESYIRLREGNVRIE